MVQVAKGDKGKAGAKRPKTGEPSQLPKQEVQQQAAAAAPEAGAEEGDVSMDAEVLRALETSVAAPAPPPQPAPARGTGTRLAAPTLRVTGATAVDGAAITNRWVAVMGPR